MLKNEIISYMFLDAKGKVYKSLNEDFPMVPASNMKILTSYFLYRILKGKEIAMDLLYSNENIIFKGGPTPLLTSQDFLFILEEISKIYDSKKTFLINNSVIDDEDIPNYWEYEDFNHCYGSLPTQLSVNEGCYSISDDFEFWNPHYIDLAPIDIQNRGFDKLLMTIFKKNSVVKTDFLDGKILSDAKLLFSHRENIDNILTHILRVSCNFSAEVMLRYIGHLYTGSKGTAQLGIKYEVDTLQQMGFNISNLRIYDGSGLSRHNLLSTKFLAELLFKIHEINDDEFFKLMPTTGEGTLKNRLKKFEYGKIRAKTGTLENVSALSGVAGNNDFFFSIIVNNSLNKTEDREKEIDELVEEII